MTTRYPTGLSLVFSDLDDTFLAHDKHIPPENRMALDRLAEADIGFVPCTGRTRLGIPEAVTRHRACRHIVACNGALIWDVVAGKALHTAFLPQEAVLEIYERVRKLNISFDVFIDGHVYAERTRFERMINTYGLDDGTKGMLRAIRTPVDATLPTIVKTYGGAFIEKVTIYWADEDTRDELADRLAAFPQIDVTSSHARNFEFMLAGVSKGAAMSWLAASTKVPLSAVIAFGDSPNDVSMLDLAGDGVAVANATTEVIEHADHVCASCDDGGPGRYLLHALSAHQ